MSINRLTSPIHKAAAVGSMPVWNQSCGEKSRKRRQSILWFRTSVLSWIVLLIASPSACPTLSPSHRPSTPPSKVRSPASWWKARGRLPTWLPAWWRWRMFWPLPWSKRSWCDFYHALCPGCPKRRLRAGSDLWVWGRYWGFLGWKNVSHSVARHSLLILTEWNLNSLL